MTATPRDPNAIFERDFHCRICGREIALATFADGDVEEFAGSFMCPACSSRDGDRLTVETIVDRLRAEGFTDFEPLDVPSTAILFHARRRRLDQPVTLKILETRNVPRQRLTRFLREARIAAGLSHSDIVRVLDVGRAEDLVFIVLERCDGITLLEMIERDGLLSPVRALAVALPVTRALVYAHQRGVIHRDLKPANIMIGRDGSVKLIDFGVAKTGWGTGRVTQPGDTLGTTAYAAPEQLIDASAASPSADVYSLGATLYHALSGVVPRTKLEFVVSRSPLLTKPLREVAPGLSAGVVRLVETCMQSRPQHRYVDAQSLQTAIEATLREMFGIDPLDGDVGALLRLSGIHAVAATAPPVLPTNEQPNSAFFGRFRQQELLELLQLVDLNTRSGALEVEAVDGRIGRVVFADGLATRARFDGRRGEEALFALLALPEGRFELILDTAPEPGDCRIRLAPVLMEVLRRKDERENEGA